MSTLAFALAATIKHDGHGGIADLLATPADVARWLADNQDLVEAVLGRQLAEQARRPAPGRAGGSQATMVSGAGTLAQGLGGRDGDLHGELHDMRRAVRALFARAVAPDPPSKADADPLMDPDAALRMINRAADRLGARHLDWPADGAPNTRWAGQTADPVALLVAAVGRSTIDFLTGPDRERLRACPAARCVKYFLQDDPRQMWCSPACGNRERVNRHYRKRHAG